MHACVCVVLLLIQAAFDITLSALFPCQLCFQELHFLMYIYIIVLFAMFDLYVKYKPENDNQLFLCAQAVLLVEWRMDSGFTTVIH